MAKEKKQVAEQTATPDKPEAGTAEEQTAPTTTNEKLVRVGLNPSLKGIWRVVIGEKSYSGGELIPESEFEASKEYKVRGYQPLVQRGEA